MAEGEEACRNQVHGHTLTRALHLQAHTSAGMRAIKQHRSISRGGQRGENREKRQSNGGPSADMLRSSPELQEDFA